MIRSRGSQIDSDVDHAIKTLINNIELVFRMKVLNIPKKIYVRQHNV